MNAAAQVDTAKVVTFPARLHVLLAQRAPVGLVIRRGPSKCVATVLWDRRNDMFSVGQWLKGRIYERRCDLSPDGKYFIYFAMNGKWKSETRGSWTAISASPYLKALALFAKGDCWHGGGLWTSSTTYWLNDGCGHEVLHDTAALHRDVSFRAAGQYGGECPGVYYNRLQRDGWTLLPGGTRKGRSTNILEKPVGEGWTLRKLPRNSSRPGKGCYWDEHELVNKSADQHIAFPDWEWADLDGDRVAWAAHGKLYAARVQPDGLCAETELYDFNTMNFVALTAPY